MVTEEGGDGRGNAHLDRGKLYSQCAVPDTATAATAGGSFHGRLPGKLSPKLLSR